MSEGAADGTRTQVWARMTNRCRIRMDRSEPYKVRDLPQDGGASWGGGRGTGSSFMPLVNQTRWEFIPSGEEPVPSDREPVHPCVFNSY